MTFGAMSNEIKLIPYVNQEINVINGFEFRKCICLIVLNIYKKKVL